MRGNGIWKQKFKNIATITTNKKVITLSVILLLIAGVSMQKAFLVHQIKHKQYYQVLLWQKKGIYLKE